MIKKLFLFLFLLANCAISMKAQNASSPYSLYGIGIISSKGLTYQENMGGLGISNGKPWVLNNINPALLPMNNFTTFDVGLYTERRTLSTSDDPSQNNTNGGLRHLTIAFPLKNLKWSMAVGLMPYSNVSYNMTSSSPVVNKEAAEASYQYKGDGGLNQVFISSGWQLVPKILSIGARAGYAFGSIEDETIINIEETVFRDENDTVGISKSFEPTRFYRSSRYSDLLFEAGLNVRKEFSKSIEANLGFVYEFGANLNTSRDELVEIYDTQNPDTPTDEVLTNVDGITYLPPKYGVGLSITKAFKWTFGIDYYTRDWSQFKSDFGTQGQMVANQKIIVGGEFTPDFFSVQNYFKRVTYQFGVNYEQTPIKINNTHIDDFGINFGVSLPVGNASIFNLGFKYGQLGTTSDGLIKEDYFRLNLGMTFNDRSFEWYRNQNKFK
jgi:hypothetical protein